MARLEDKHKPGLPPPPAATRRGANPWKFSDTARKAEPRREDRGPDLLESLVTDIHPDEPAEAGQEPWTPDDNAPPQTGEHRGRFGLWLLAIIGVAVLILLRVLFEARETGDWVRVIAPLLAIAFVAHGWWKLRQRRRESKKTKSD